MERMQPIGVFDSGVGGLTVVKNLWKLYPQEQIVYFGDTAHLPYGQRHPQEIIQFGLEILDFLLGYNVKAVIAACNTSSSVSLDHLQGNSPVPVFGMIRPGVQAALKKTKNKKIGVIATKATVDSAAYESTFHLSDSDVQVISQACPLFVPLVESGRTERRETYQIARSYLRPLLEAGVDTLVFGCTHYPFLSRVIKDIMGEEIQLVDPAIEVVRELNKSMELTGDREKRAEPFFFASGPTRSFYTMGSELLGSFPYRVEQVVLNGEDKEKDGLKDIQREIL